MTKIKALAQTYPRPTTNMPTSPSSKPGFSFQTGPTKEYCIEAYLYVVLRFQAQGLRNRRKPKGYSCSLSSSDELIPERGRETEPWVPNKANNNYIKPFFCMPAHLSFPY